MLKSLLHFLLLLAATAPLHAQKPKPLNGPPTAAEPKPTSAAERLSAHAKRTAAEQRSLVSNVSFRNIGPTIMSGRVTDLDVDPADPTRFYVAYASGGVFFTGNNGTTFSPVFDQESSITIGDIAVNWSLPQPEIWVGTGECNSSRSSYAGTGLFHSADGGKTWDNRGLTESHHIGKVLLHPTQPGTLWVAVIGHLYSPSADRGLYKTTDGGRTWKKTLFIDDNTGVIDVVPEPGNPDVLYAISWHRERRAWNFVEAGPGSALRKSTDGGETWTVLTTASSGFPQGNDIGRIGVAVFPGNPALLYAIVDNQTVVPAKAPTNGKPSLSPARFRSMTREQFLDLNATELDTYLRRNRFPAQHTAASVTAQVSAGTLQPAALADFVSDANADLFNRPIVGAEVYRSEDGGRSWKKANKAPLTDLFYTYGYYFGKIWVSPTDANDVFIAGVQLLHSTNGGKTFSPADGANQHGDHHALWIDPKRRGHLINGNDGGVNISWDNGVSWFKANTPAVGQFYGINVDMATPYNVYGGLQDNGVWVGPSTYEHSLAWYGDGQYPYKFIYGGDGMQVMVDPRDNVTVYTGYQFGHYARVNRLTGESEEVRPKQTLGDAPLRFNWQAPVWLSVHNPDILYMCAQRVFRSMNQGRTFTAVSGDLTRGGRTGDVPYGTLSTIHESPLRFGLLYVGSDDGLIHVSRNGGEAWTRISDGLPQHLRVNRVIASAHAEGRVYAVLSGFQWDHFAAYVYVSENYGATWKAIATDLPAEPVNVLREDPVNANLLFIGTDNGLYCSTNGGQTTMRMTGGLPAVAVHDLVIHSREHDLVVGTHGRSLFVASISDLELINDVDWSNALSIIKLSTRKITNPETYDEELAAAVSWTVAAPSTVSIRLLTADESCEVVRQTDTTEKGLNRLQFTLATDSAHTEALKKWLSTNQPNTKLKPDDQGNAAIPPGRYMLVIEDRKGNKAQRTLTITDE